MRKHLLIVIGIVAGLAVGAGGAVAGSGRASEKPAESAGGSTEAIGGATAPGARLAILIDGDTFTAGPPADFAVRRSVGVQSVTNPSAGVFCIKPQTSAIPATQLNTVVPTVASAYTGSGTYQAFAQYKAPRDSGCPAGTFSIRTFSESGGSVDPNDNDVAFTVVVD